jgi:hypothetical protein
MIQTFKNKTVLFIGDPMLRVLFRACVKMLQQEHIHSNGEADGCRIDTKLIQGKLTTGSIFFSFIHFRWTQTWLRRTCSEELWNSFLWHSFRKYQTVLYVFKYTYSSNDWWEYEVDCRESYFWFNSFFIRILRPEFVSIQLFSTVRNKL